MCYHFLQVGSADKSLIIGQVLVNANSHGGGGRSDEDEAGVVGGVHLLGRLLGPLPGVVLVLRRDPGAGVEGKVDLAHGAMVLKAKSMTICINYRCTCLVD